MSSVRRAINASQSAGLVLGSVKLHPDGTIELCASRQEANEPANDFDRFDARGLL